MRTAARRAKPISRYRHQRISVDVEPQRQAVDDDWDVEPEKIEVHVHVHRPAGEAKAKRPKSPPRAELTGALFDWKGHYDVVCQKPAEQKLQGLARLKTCHGCYQPVPIFAQRCSRCSTPHSRRPLMTAIAASALVAVAVVFGVFVHVFGAGPIAERVSPKPIGQWSDDDYYYEVVEVPVTPSPFGTAAPAAPHGPTVSNDHLSIH